MSYGTAAMVLGKEHNQMFLKHFFEIYFIEFNGNTMNEGLMSSNVITTIKYYRRFYGLLS